MKTKRRRTKLAYRRIDISTLDGLKKAERLKSRGWKIIQSSLLSVLMERRPNADAH